MTIREALAQANQKLSKKIDNALTQEVYTATQMVEAEVIKHVVYEAYAPRAYRRRGYPPTGGGGLGDPYNIVMKGGAAKNGKLEVINVTEPNPYLNGVNRDGGLSTTPSSRSIAQLVENGIINTDGYGYDYWPGGFARPFTARTVTEMKKCDTHVYALKAGLKRQGVKVK